MNEKDCEVPILQRKVFGKAVRAEGHTSFDAHSDSLLTQLVAVHAVKADVSARLIFETTEIENSFWPCCSYPVNRITIVASANLIRISVTFIFTRVAAICTVAAV